MCYHQYTMHSCGHKSTSIGKCDAGVLATTVLFCDSYHVLRRSSFWPCGGTYCKQDKETARWVENGSALLTACDDDLLELKDHILALHSELQGIQNQEKAWLSMHENYSEHAQAKNREYSDLTQTHAETRARRQLIVGGIKTARQKQEATANRCAKMLNQARAQAARMREVQQDTDGQLPHPLSASPSATQKTDNASEGGMMTHVDSSIWESGDTSGTPCRSTTNAIFPIKPTPERPESLAQVDYSPPTLASAFSFQDLEETVDHKPSPPKKRRGRPPKIVNSSVTDDQATTTKRRATKNAVKKESPAQKLPSAGARRSGRVKQEVSYAESSTSSPGGASDVEDDDDDGWQGENYMEEDDMEIGPTTVQKIRLSVKRTAASPPRDPRLLKRRANYDGIIYGA